MALELFDLPTCHVLLEIVNYQFPGHTERLDANWLQVRGRIEDPRGSWSFVDPCLTTQELLKLELWLGALDPSAPAVQSCYFTEPCLTFHFNSGPHPVLDLVLSHEAAPPWASDEQRLEGVSLQVPLTTNRPEVLQAMVRGLIARYPVVP